MFNFSTALRRWLWRWDAPLDRRAYATIGVTLALVKYAVDALLIRNGTGRVWTPLDYLNSAPLGLNWPAMSWRGVTPPEWLLPVLLVWTLPFVWLGVTMTARRAMDAGWSEWMCLAFFVPYVNYVTMLLLCVAPTRARAEAVTLNLGAATPAFDPSARRLPRAILAVAGGMTVGLAMVWIAVVLARTYSAALFIGSPFAMGMVVGFIVNCDGRVTTGETNTAVILAVLLSGFALFAVAFEGAVCILMAAPIAIPLALLGGLIGRTIAVGSNPKAGHAMMAVLALPLWVTLEPARSTGQALHVVESSIEIDVAPGAVWPRVIAFQPLPPPEELIFRAGVAFPMRAEIDGTGVGAVRRCVFSTGSFVEPVTRWEPAETLAFDVVSAPPPMTEWSPYANVHPPHLDGFLRARRGEFRLVPLDGGRTRLEGRMWYEIQMGPEGYWQVWSDYLIHRIHMRVLEHIKREAEASR